MSERLFDSHAHFDTFCAAGEGDAVLARAAAAGVARIVAIGGSPAANALARSLASAAPGRVRATAGYDRDLAGAPPPIEELAAAAADPLVCAIGEAGLDYHYEPGTAPQQRALFRAQLELAAALGKPVVVHSRDADGDTLALLRDFASRHPGGPGRLGVLHCFTGSAAFAAQLVELGLLISFSGIVSFKSAGDLRAVAREVPADRYLIETDAPYLAPVPFRGRTNEPAYVVEVARAVAEARGVSLQEAARESWMNACRLFNWPEEQL